MLNRHIDSIIDEHFASTKKALLLTGARQTGKTFAIRKYAQQKGLLLVEMNFLLQPETKDIPKGVANVQELLLRISAYAKQPLESGRTLIFFDEVQEYADILTWIKALVEEGRFMYALSGSLLGLELKNIRSLPVGYLSEYQVFPLDIDEFFRNIGITDEVIASVRRAWEQHKPVDQYIHEKLMRLYNLYLIIGGMPQAVQTYVDTNDLNRVLREQQSILALYRKDIARYDSENKLYIHDIFDLIPSELNAKNKRFILKSLNEHIKFSRHENSFVWLRDADMALPVYNVEEPRAPLKLNEIRNLFKLFQNDVGLLASQYVSGIQLQILQGEVNINNGAIYENAVAQELHAHGWKLHYFNSKKQGEVDFLLEQDDEIIPLEVKSGKDYQRHLALNNLLSNPEYAIRRAIVLCNGNMALQGEVLYAPVYMTMFLHHRCSNGPLLYHPELPYIS
ncbi:MAG: ATP-binding protein [Paludibacteraceae bacterium]|nr:ATP-binding protein [Paludibacteraceae bacterium]